MLDESPPLAPVSCCPLCRTTDAQEVSRSSAPIGLVRCERCGLVRATATYAAGFLDGSYYGTRAEAYAEEAAFVRGRKRRQVDGFNRRCAGVTTPPCAGAAALDLGCGTGVLLDVLAELGWATEGVERSPAAAVASRRHRIHDVDVEHETAELGHRYELVTATHFIEHLRDPVAGLRFMARHLAPGGRVILEVPNWEDWARSLWGARYRPLALGDHVSFFDRATLREAIARAGLVVAAMWATPQAASMVLPSVLSLADVVSRAIGGLVRRTPPAAGVASETRVPSRVRATREHLVQLLDRLDPICERVAGPDAGWGANLVAVATVR